MAIVRPRVLLNFASSLDGKIAPSPSVRPPSFTMSPQGEDHRRMRELRAKADAILIGASNLRADDPDLALTSGERRRRRDAGEKEPMRVVVTRRGDGVSPSCKMFDPTLGGRALVFHSAEIPEDRREQLSQVATMVALGERTVDTPMMLAWMTRELRIGVLLCEGGGVIAGELLRARAVDELFLTLVPRILGGSDAPTWVAGPGILPDEAPDASLGAMERVGGELFLRYDFRW
jgi:riboflavin-specific deaminase-like protein